MLTPYLKPQAINGGMLVSSKLTHAIYSSRDALDKRNKSWFATTVQTIDAAKDVAETIANAVGIRSPYFVIGEIPKNEDHKQYIWSSLDKALVGIVRAVSNTYNRWGYTQEGVIIDCLGDINTQMSVEFTTKPLVYVGNNVVDSRIRKPSTVRATIAVSNHLADDAAGMALNHVAAWDPTGTADVARDQLLYGGLTRAQYALYRLRWLMENGQPFTVYTPHGYYENMLIQSLTPRTDESNMDMLLCDITYQEAILSAPYLSDEELKKRVPTRTVIKAGDGRMVHVREWAEKGVNYVSNLF